MKNITPPFKIMAWFGLGLLVAISLNTALAAVTVNSPTVPAANISGINIPQDYLQTDTRLDPQETPGGGWNLPPAVHRMQLGEGPGDPDDSSGTALHNKGQLFFRSNVTPGIGVKSSAIGAYILNEGTASDGQGTVDAGTLIEGGEIGLFTQGTIGLRAGRDGNTVSVLAEGENAGAMGQGELTGLYAEATNTSGVGEVGVYGRSEEAGGVGLFGKSGGAGVIGYDPDGAVTGILGKDGYGLFTESGASFGDLVSEGFTANGKLLTPLAALDMMNPGVGVLWQADQFTHLDSGGASGNNKYIAINSGLRDSTVLMEEDLTITDQLLVAAVNIAAFSGVFLGNNEITVTDDLEVKADVAVQGGNFSTDGTVTAVNNGGIGFFKTCSRMVNTAAVGEAVSVSCFEAGVCKDAGGNLVDYSYNASLIGCHAQAESGIGISKIIPDMGAAVCTAKMNGTGDLTVVAQCFVPRDEVSNCGDGTCDPADGETIATCPFDCAVCGDNDCDLGETVQNCPEDCDVCVDNDGDGYGAPANANCNHPELDCDDTDAAVNPGAAELCNGVDDNCDGVLGAEEVDDDGDGFMICEGDCDDTNSDIYPGADEDCDGIDTDCDGALGADEVDVDGDGFMICEGDCDDTEAGMFPGNPEICDGLDNDCDGVVPADEVDADGDGVMVCEDDCDDGDAAVNPGVAEICDDGVDNDCDGLVDEDDPDCVFGEVCDNGVDDDGDGLIDFWDPECPCADVIEVEPDANLGNHQEKLINLAIRRVCPEGTIKLGGVFNVMDEVVVEDKSLTLTSKLNEIGELVFQRSISSEMFDMIKISVDNSIKDVVKIIGLKIDGNQRNVTGIYSNLYRHDEVIIDSNEIINCNIQNIAHPGGIEIHVPSDGLNNKIFIENNNIASNSKISGYSYGNVDLDIDGQGNAVVFSNNIISDNIVGGVAIVLDTSNNIQITNNQIFNNEDTSCSLRLLGSYNEIEVTNNDVYQNDFGMSFLIEGNYTKLNVSDNKFYDNDYSGLYVSFDPFGNSDGEVNIINNRSYNNGVSGIDLSIPRDNYEHKVLVLNNLVFDNVESGLKIFGVGVDNVLKVFNNTFDRNGIFVEDVSSNDYLIQNNLITNIDGAIKVDFTTNFSGNFVIENNAFANTNGHDIYDQVGYGWIDISNNIISAVVDNVYCTPDYDGDYHLAIGSDCIDLGNREVWDNPNIIPNSIPLEDLDGNSRIMCDDVDPGAYELQACPGCADADGDGYSDENCGGADCDDGDAAINPGAAEVCDNVTDDDCDGLVDCDDAVDCPETDPACQADECAGTDTECGIFPNCENCNLKDKCYGDTDRDYGCNAAGTACVVVDSDDCSDDCSCECGGYDKTESPANGNCDDNKDNNCDGKKDCYDPGCSTYPDCICDGTVSSCGEAWPCENCVANESFCVGDREREFSCVGGTTCDIQIGQDCTTAAGTGCSGTTYTEGFCDPIIGCETESELCSSQCGPYCGGNPLGVNQFGDSYDDTVLCYEYRCSDGVDNDCWEGNNGADSDCSGLDFDGDGIKDRFDSCPHTSDDADDADCDGIADACDPVPNSSCSCENGNDSNCDYDNNPNPISRMCYDAYEDYCSDRKESNAGNNGIYIKGCNSTSCINANQPETAGCDESFFLGRTTWLDNIMTDLFYLGVVDLEGSDISDFEYLVDNCIRNAERDDLVRTVDYKILCVIEGNTRFKRYYHVDNDGIAAFRDRYASELEENCSDYVGMQDAIPDPGYGW